MSERDTRSIPQKLADNDLINAALSRAAKEAKLSHAYAGRSVPISVNQQIVWLTPDEVFAYYSVDRTASAKVV